MCGRACGRVRWSCKFNLLFLDFTQCCPETVSLSFSFYECLIISFTTLQVSHTTSKQIHPFVFPLQMLKCIAANKRYFLYYYVCIVFIVPLISPWREIVSQTLWNSTNVSFGLPNCNLSPFLRIYVVEKPGKQISRARFVFYIPLHPWKLCSFTQHTFNGFCPVNTAVWVHFKSNMCIWLGGGSITAERLTIYSRMNHTALI